MLSSARLLLLVSVTLLASACGVPSQVLRSSQEGRRLYRNALEWQAEAEQLMQAGDTAGALPLLHKAYVGFVDSGHTEAYPSVLVGIWMAENTLHLQKINDLGRSHMISRARASAVDLLYKMEAERQRARTARMLGALGVAVALLLAAAAALLLQRQRRRRLEAERELLQARLELASAPSPASVSSPALELALRSYEQLCCRYVPEGDNSALLHEFRQQLADLRNDAAFERELEESLSVSAPALLDAVRAVPDLKDGDRRLLRFLAAGIPTYMTGAVLGKSRSAVNMQVSRLRARIESLDDASLRDLLLPVLTSRHSGRPRR